MQSHIDVITLFLFFVNNRNFCAKQCLPVLIVLNSFVNKWLKIRILKAPSRAYGEHRIQRRFIIGKIQ